MFTGIIECLAEVLSVESSGSNRVFRMRAAIAPEFRVDESVSHNGVCLTVEDADREARTYRVTAILETLQRSNLGVLQRGDRVNLERALPAGARLDGHFVQGHVDAKGVVQRIEERDGSREFFIQYAAEYESLVVPKGSIALNGISLTIASSAPEQNLISVAIIPHTWERTDMSGWRVGTEINVEFDVLGKYVQKLMQQNAGGSPVGSGA